MNGEDYENLVKELVVSKTKLKQPRKYKVFLLNDDYTPMEFVVEVIEGFFGMNQTKATYMMLEVHTKGKAICGVYTHDIAETKVVQVINFARSHKYPLMCDMELE